MPQPSNHLAAASAYRVESPDWTLATASTAPPEDAPDKKALKKRLADSTQAIYDLQRMLYADNRYSVLLVFQAMDAAGKDSTIRHVFSGVNPAGFQVSNFKRPSAEELDHDFLWRSAIRLPERGRIGVFNRSYYEEALVVRVHPELLAFQRLPGVSGSDDADDAFWAQRLQSIADHEHHLTRNGTVVLKFFLNVSRGEQKKRFLDRLDTPRKQWKFEPADIRERGFWPDYMQAYQDAIAATSKPWAPWYAIPADDKPFMRATVADIVARTLGNLGLSYPSPDPDVVKRHDALRQQLIDE